MLLSLFKLLIYLDNAKSCSVFFNRKDVMLKKIWCDIQWNKSKMFWTLSTSSHGQFATEELSLEPSKNVSNYRNAWLATVSQFDLSLWKKGWGQFLFKDRRVWRRTQTGKNSKMSQSDLRNPSTHQLRLQRFCISQISPSLAVHSNACRQKHHSLNLPPEQERLR